MRVSEDARFLVSELQKLGMETFSWLDVEEVMWKNFPKPLLTKSTKWAPTAKNKELVKVFSAYIPFTKMIKHKRKDVEVPWSEVKPVYEVIHMTDGPDLSRQEMVQLPRLLGYTEREISSAIGKIHIQSWNIQYLLRVLQQFDVGGVQVSSTKDSHDTREYVAVARSVAEQRVRQFERRLLLPGDWN